MLAYVFWHRPADGVEPEAYAAAVRRFHHSLAVHAPGGFLHSVSLHAPAPNWLDGAREALEDWYVVEDFAALGVLGEAAVGRGHRSVHDEAARRAGPGAGGVYRLLEGSANFDEVRVAVWIEKPRGVASPLLAALLGDGMDGSRSGLWQRQLVLGPAPEYCLLSDAVPAGVAPGRLPHGWSATVSDRTPL